MSNFEHRCKGRLGFSEVEQQLTAGLVSTVCDVPVAPPRTKHYAKKYAARKKKSEMDSLLSRSVNTGVLGRKEIAAPRSR